MGINITLDLKTTRDARNTVAARDWWLPWRSARRCALGVAQATLRRCEYAGAQRAAIRHLPTRLCAFDRRSVDSRPGARGLQRKLTAPAAGFETAVLVEPPSAEARFV
jgi:hypothetical protein